MTRPLLALLVCLPLLAATPAEPLVPLRVLGEDFVDPSGHPVRFWGVNLVALYPEAATADALAARLAERGVNLVRPHHLLRPSRDWNPTLSGGALALYRDNSRDPDPVAWERFDYLNAALRRQGIYLQLALRWSRVYQPGDAAVLTTDDDDQAAWAAAIAELNARPWREAMDARKTLPMIDERCAELDLEFTRRLLTHINPHTGQSYANDPQVVMLEIINEASTEYAFVCGNTVPEYFAAKLQAQWERYALEHGVDDCPVNVPATPAQVQARLAFFRELDERYFRRLIAAAREAGYQGAITGNNLWRGDHNLSLHAELADYIEDHAYVDPLVTAGPADFLQATSRSMVAGKPFFLGEFNLTENTRLRDERQGVRAMLPVAASVYGALHNWSGVAWFAWVHGGAELGPDGRGRHPFRHGTTIGSLINDELLQDHLRTTGLIFRQRLLQASREPQAMVVDSPLATGDYHRLMAGKYSFAPGWQSIHAIRKRFGQLPPEQATASWQAAPPTGPLVSDTGEIVKDCVRQQLGFRAPRAEGFSGWLDAAAPTALASLRVTRQDGFATLVAVTLDGQPLATSRHLLLSKTLVTAAGPEAVELGLAVRVAAPAWELRITQPHGWQALPVPLSADADGWLTLPDAAWHEAELIAR